jgi:GT2 family glycosyltransferase
MNRLDREPADVSVVIATRGDRPQALLRCLRALDEGTVRPREVVVVNQGGEQLPDQPVSVTLTAVPQDGHGLSSGRNLGIATASCPLVAITDDDCVPAQDWLERGLAAFAADPGLVAVCGPVAPLPDPTGALVPVSSRRSARSVTATRSFSPWQLGSGGNTIVRRSWLERIGSYDERLGAGSAGLAGEDVDLIHRLLRAGAPVRYDGAVTVLHEQKLPREHRARRRGYGFGVGGACGLWARSHDVSAGPVLVAWLLLRLRLLAAACVRGRLAAAADELRVLAGTVAGVRYGLANGRRGAGAR